MQIFSRKKMNLIIIIKKEGEKNTHKFFEIIFNEIAKSRRHDGANDQLHHGSVALHVGVDRDVHATHLLFVLGRVALVGLAILLGHSPSDTLELAFRALEAQLLGQGHKGTLPC